MVDSPPRSRILVVDDQAEIRDLTAGVLTAEGYDVVAAGGGWDALERLTVEPFDLVLLDINMPGLDGWSVLRMIRADEQLGAVPVVMFSIKGEIRDKVVGLQEGAVDFITKPFQVDELLAQVRRVLDPGAGWAEARS